MDEKMNSTDGKDVNISTDSNEPTQDNFETTKVDGLARGLITGPVSNVMEDNFLRYSMSVIVARALPDVRDGMKPVHRRILYSMEKNGLRASAKTVKSANIVGEVMGKFHPHGDTAIYDSMARLAQPWSVRYTLIHGQGNFGSMDGDPPAAYRYTEAKMTKISEDLLTDIDKETVDFRDNYDGQHQEPEVLPSKLPNLLMNGQLGIAVGMATNIPPHNLGELIDACVAMIDGDMKLNVSDLMEYIQGPDFPTGGVIYGKQSLLQAYSTGRGGVPVRGVAEVVEGKKKGTSSIVVTEIPYSVNKASLVEKIGELHRDKKIQGISDLRDETSKGKVRIVIDLKRDAYPKKVLNQLYKHTSLQTSFSFNMVALVDGIQPQVLGLTDMITEFIKHRQEVVRRRTEYELRKAKERAHILEGLKIALDNIDEVIATIRASKTTDEAKTNLIKKFKLSALQAAAILAMQLRALTGLERQKIEDELAALMKLIAKLEEILSSAKNILKVVKTELLESKEKYADDRRTKVIAQELNGLSDEDLIPNEEVAVMLTKSGYIKRTQIDLYRQQHRGGKGKRGIKTKEEDVVEHLSLANTHDYLLFFTNKGRVFRVKAYEVPNASLTAKGIAVVNILQLQPEEFVTAMLNITDYEKDAALVMCTLMGTVKMSSLDVLKNIRTSGIIAINLDEGDELRWIRSISGDHDVMVATKQGYCIRFSKANLRLMGRAARGVRGIKLRSGDQVVGMEVVDDGTRVLIVSENGYGKTTKVSNFTQHKRGGLGTKAASVTKKTGVLNTVKFVPDNAGAVLMITKEGQTIKISIDDVPTLGRVTQGVRLMRMSDGDKVTSVVILEDSDSEEELSKVEEPKK